MASAQQTPTQPSANPPERTAAIEKIVAVIVRENAETLRKLSKT
jgi:hypothetical protein